MCGNGWRVQEAARPAGTAGRRTCGSPVHAVLVVDEAGCPGEAGWGGRVACFGGCVGVRGRGCSQAGRPSTQGTLGTRGIESARDFSLTQKSTKRTLGRERRGGGARQVAVRARGRRVVALSARQRVARVVGWDSVGVCVACMHGWVGWGWGGRKRGRRVRCRAAAC